MDYMYVLSWKLLNIRLLSEYFATLLKRLHLKKIATKCSIFLHWLYIFLIGRSRFLEGIRIKFYLGRVKRRVRGGMGEKAKMRVIFAKFPLFIEIQTLSHKLLVRQTTNYHHCNWHTQKPMCRDFQVILSSSSWSKTTLCILRNKYGYQIENAMEKYVMLWTGSNIEPGVQIYMFEVNQMSSFQDMTYYNSIIGIFLNFFLSKVKLLFEVNYFSDNQILLIIFNFF